MGRGFNWTKVAQQQRIRTNGTEQIESDQKRLQKRTDAFLARFKHKKKTKTKRNRRPKRVMNTAVMPVIYEWDPPR